MAGRVTIKSIAADLGISHMTVSRALSNHPRVKAQTREMVLNHANKLGYVRNIAARAIRGDRTTIVGLLLPNLENEFYARFADALAKLVDGKGLQLIIHLTNDDFDTETRSILKLQEIQPRTVVMVPAPGDPETEQVYLRDLHIVQLIRKRESLSSHGSVMVADGEALSQAVQHLARHGHTRIGYIGGEPSLSSGASRLAAFLSGIEASGLANHTDDVITGMPSFDLGYRSANKLVERARISALVCGGFEISSGALHACLERDLRLPRDIAFIGYGDPSYYRWIHGGISTIAIKPDTLAEKAAALIVQDESEEAESSSHQSLKAELVIRHSSAPA